MKLNPVYLVFGALSSVFGLSITHNWGLFINKIPSGGNVLQA